MIPTIFTQEIAKAAIDYEEDQSSHQSAPYHLDTSTWKAIQSSNMITDDRPTLELFANMAAPSYQQERGDVPTAPTAWVSQSLRASVDQCRNEYTARGGVCIHEGVPYDVRELSSRNESARTRLRIIGGRHEALASPRRKRSWKTRPVNSIEGGDYFVIVESLPVGDTSLAAPTLLVVSEIPSLAYQSIFCGITRDDGARGISYTGTSFDPGSQKVYRPTQGWPFVSKVLDQVVPEIRQRAHSHEGSTHSPQETTGLLSGKDKASAYFRESRSGQAWTSECRASSTQGGLSRGMSDRCTRPRKAC